MPTFVNIVLGERGDCVQIAPSKITIEVLNDSLVIFWTVFTSVSTTFDLHCRIKREWPIPYCHKDIVHVPRHLEKVHYWPKNQDRAAVSRFNMRKKYTFSTAESVKAGNSKKKPNDGLKNGGKNDGKNFEKNGRKNGRENERKVYKDYHKK